MHILIEGDNPQNNKTVHQVQSKSNRDQLVFVCILVTILCQSVCLRAVIEWTCAQMWWVQRVLWSLVSSAMLSVEHQCVLPAKKTSRYQRVYRNLSSSTITFPPLTHRGRLMIWGLKPGKLPFPKPDILQFVSLLLLDGQLFPPHCLVPLPHFPACTIRLLPSAFLTFSYIMSSVLPLFLSRCVTPTLYEMTTPPHTHTHSLLALV